MLPLIAFLLGGSGIGAYGWHTIRQNPPEWLQRRRQRQYRRQKLGYEPLDQDMQQGWFTPDGLGGKPHPRQPKATGAVPGQHYTWRNWSDQDRRNLGYIKGSSCQCRLCKWGRGEM